MDEFAEVFKSFISNVGVWIGVIGTVITIISRFKKGIWDKITDEVGKENMFNAVVLLTELLKIYSMDDIVKRVKAFHKEESLETDMKVSVFSIQKILEIKTAFTSSKVPEFIRKEEERKRVSAIKNRKSWQRIKEDPDVAKALDNVLNIFRSNVKLKKIMAGNQERIEQINNMITTMEMRIPENREARKKLETIREKAAIEKETTRLNKVKEKLWRVFADHRP